MNDFTENNSNVNYLKTKTNKSQLAECHLTQFTPWSTFESSIYQHLWCSLSLLYFFKSLLRKTLLISRSIQHFCPLIFIALHWICTRRTGIFFCRNDFFSKPAQKIKKLQILSGPTYDVEDRVGHCDYQRVLLSVSLSYCLHTLENRCNSSSINSQNCFTLLFIPLSGMYKKWPPFFLPESLGNFLEILFFRFLGEELLKLALNCVCLMLPVCEIMVVCQYERLCLLTRLKVYMCV